MSSSGVSIGLQRLLLAVSSAAAVLTLHLDHIAFFAELPVNRGSFSSDINNYELEEHH